LIESEEQIMTEMISNHVLYTVVELIDVLIYVGNAMRGFIDACFSFTIYLFSRLRLFSCFVRLV
jgi:hypothetical protein